MTQAEDIVQLIEQDILTDGGRKITPDSMLFTGGFLDSLQLTSLLLSIEKKYQVKVGMFEISPENFDTPAQIANWINQRKA